MFSSVVGHSKTLQTVKELLKKGLFPQSCLFVGPEGVGKKTVAVETLTALSGSPLLVKILGEEKPPTVDEVREASTWLFTKPASGRAKGVVIDNADEMRGEAANALLKTLEEPPEYGYLILVAKNEQGVLPTLRSRCKVFRFGRLSSSTVEFVLKRLGVNPDPKTLKLANGSVGLALKMAQKNTAKLVEAFARAVRSKDKGQAVVELGELFSSVSREEALLFLDGLENLLYNQEAFFRWEPVINKAREHLKFYGKPQSVAEWMLLELFV